ncbi:MAG: hypothetical protein QXH57_00260 [Sulfolobales archaeon]
MSSSLDRLLRLIDSADFRSYSRLVLTSSSKDLNILKDVLGDGRIVYLLINNSVKLDSDRKGFWFLELGNVPTKIRLYAIEEVEEVIVFIDLIPHHLLISYELMREVKRVSINSKSYAMLKVPTNPSEHDLINLLTYAAVLIKENIVDFIILIHYNLIEYLKTLTSGDVFPLCVVEVLKNSSNISKYLSRYRKIGMLTCFPRADLKIFDTIANIVKLSHHLIGDYNVLIDAALIIVTHNLKELDHEVSRLKKELSISELEVISIRGGGDFLTVLTIEPNNSLVLELLKLKTKAYELVKKSRLSLSLEDLTRVTG